MTEEAQEKKALFSTDGQVQAGILGIVLVAREVDVSSLIERLERGAPVQVVDGYTTEEIRSLATGVARLRRMIAVVDENRKKRFGGMP